MKITNCVIKERTVLQNQNNNSCYKKYFFNTNKYNLSYDNVSFGSKDLLSKTSNEITKKVRESIIKENVLGFGSEGTVYRIPDTDYCVKIFHDSNYTNYGNWTKKLSKKMKLNHVVAEAQNGALLMKYIEGISLKYCCPKEIYDLPAKTFIDLFAQVSAGSKAGLNYDTAPSNLIYNSKTKSLTALDFKNGDTIEQSRPISAVYTTIRAKYFTNTDKCLNRKLGGRFLNIVIDELTKQEKPRFSISQYDIQRLLFKIKQTQAGEIPSQMKFLETSLIRLLDLIKRKNVGKDVLNLINGEIKYSKCIIKQTLSL